MQTIGEMEMIRRTCLWVIGTTIFLAASATVVGQAPPTGAARGGGVSTPYTIPSLLIERALEARGNLILRESPPSGLFLSKGPIIGSIPGGEQVEVVERKEVRTLFGTQEWLRVRSADKENPELSGWVFNGKIELEDGTVLPYLTVVPESEESEEDLL